MSAIERITVTMPAEMAATLRATVEAGEYASTSEIVREALRDWTRSRDAERRELEALREAIRVGLNSGPAIPAEEVFAELRARYADKLYSRDAPNDFAGGSTRSDRDRRFHCGR